MPSSHSGVNVHVPSTAPPGRSPVLAADDALLHAAGAVTGEHVLVIGHDTPGIVASLACRGAAEITLLGPNARPETETVDLALATGIASIAYAERAITMAHRAMTRTGRIVLRTAVDPDDGLADAITRALRDHGFCAIWVQTVGDRIVVSAASPLYGGHRLG